MIPAVSRRGKRTKDRGRILAMKLGMNPNSSSLGVDVTFLLMGAASLSLFTPVVSALVRGFATGRSDAAETDRAETAKTD